MGQGNRRHRRAAGGTHVPCPWRNNQAQPAVSHVGLGKIRDTVPAAKYEDWQAPIGTANERTGLIETLREMEIVLPERAFTAGPVRRQTANTGTMSHDVATVPVGPAFTEADPQRLCSLPDDVSSTAGVPDALLARGHSNGAIASEPGLSVKTVATNVSVIFDKLEVADRAGAVIRARDAGFRDDG